MGRGIKMKKIRVNKQDAITYCIMLVIGMFFYLVPGEWISIQDDSGGYLEKIRGEGVLPGYPVFLSFFRSIMTEQYFLNGVVIAQSLLAVICTFLFVLTLKKQFKLRNAETVLLYIVSMMPFSIYLPEAGITHQIMTEGITYAIFYIYFISVVKAVWMRKYIWYAGSLVTAFVLGLIRSQMLFLQAVCLLVLLWIALNRAGKGIGKKCIAGALAVCVGAVLSFGSYKGIYGVVRYDIYRGEINRASEKEKEKEAENIETKEEEKTPEKEKQTEGLEEGADGGATVNEEKEDKNEIHVMVWKETSQFDTVLISRGLYEADKEDEVLFEDEVTRAIFRRAYELADESGHLYIHARPGLYMWRDLVHDQMRMYVVQAINEYNASYPGQINEPDKITREIGLKILLKHFDRYLYHTLRLMIPSFIAAIFFQIEPVYLLCHFITLLFYIMAIAGMIIIYKKNKNRQAADMMGAILCIIFIMVIIVNLIFVGLQRYMVYGMGIFWCSAYLVMREIILKRLPEQFRNYF